MEAGEVPFQLLVPPKELPEKFAAAAHAKTLAQDIDTL
jgi:hypothetical protein